MSKRASPLLSELLRCPTCQNALKGADKALRCPACDTSVPRLGGVSCLLPEPAERIASWRNELSRNLKNQSAQADLLARELVLSGLLPATRRRLLQLIHARRAFRQQCKRLYRPLANKNRNRVTELNGSSSWLPMYRNVLRDWAWGNSENRDFQRLVGPLVPHRPGRLLVLGAGACRLAYDLHRSHKPTATVALDLNPFELLPAARIVHGRSVDLHEFPPHPRGSSGESAPLWRCRAPAPVGNGFHIVLADGRQVPAPDGSFDVVLTPYFLDAIGGTTSSHAAEISRLLSPGGLWVNIGPLAFGNRPPAELYGEREFLSIVRTAGFRLLSHRRAVVPHMQSPACGFRPAWDVLVFLARRSRSTPRASLEPVAPSLPWLKDALSVPSMPAKNIEILRLHRLKDGHLRADQWLIRRPGAAGEELCVDADIVKLLRLLDGRRSLLELTRTWVGRSNPADIESTRWILRTLHRRGLFERS